MPSKSDDPTHVALVISKRGKLKEYLQGCIIQNSEAENPKSFDASVLGVLEEATEGLEALDFGEVPDLFAPIATKRKGRHPRTAEHFRQVAYGFIEILLLHGYEVKKALNAVAKAYFGERANAEAIKQWRKRIKKQLKDADFAIGSPAREMLGVERTMITIGRKSTEAEILARLTKAGKAYQSAMRSRKGPIALKAPTNSQN